MEDVPRAGSRIARERKAIGKWKWIAMLEQCWEWTPVDLTKIRFGVYDGPLSSTNKVRRVG